jgi:exopolyphosphatase/guanosine-5'-triphosphate,3'-diphosphate pyrophosphatase
MPKPAHLEYAALAPGDRHRVDVLASLLRIADGLDIGHLGTVTDVGADLEEDGVRITAQAESDISGEVEAAMQKADLFERTFGLPVTIDVLEGVRA